MADFTALTNGNIAQFLPYRMGKPVEVLQDELKVKNIIRLDAAESPYGVSRKVRDVLLRSEDLLPLYPDRGAYFLKEALHERFGYDSTNITVGAGSSGLATLLCRAFLNNSVNVVIPQFNNIALHRAAEISGAEVIVSAIHDDWTPDIDAILTAVNHDTRMIMFNNPSNPIGAFLVKSQLQQLLELVPDDIIVVVNEELVEYLGDGYEDCYTLISKFPNLVLLRSFSHAYGLAGMRVGYMLSGEEICGIINVLRDPYNVSGVALECARAALYDKTFLGMVLHHNAIERNRYRTFCAVVGLAMIDTVTNSVTIDFGQLANKVYQELLANGVLTRPMTYMGLNTLINIGMSHPAETDFVIERLESIFLTRVS